MALLQEWVSELAEYISSEVEFVESMDFNTSIELDGLYQDDEYIFSLELDEVGFYLELGNVAIDCITCKWMSAGNLDKCKEQVFESLNELIL